MASASKAQFRGLFDNGQAYVPLRIKLHKLSFIQPELQSKQITRRPKVSSPIWLDKKISKAMEMWVFWMKDRVKQKVFFVYWKPGIQNRGDYFTKNHPTHHHREICDSYLYMENALLKINNKVVQERENVVLTSNHTVVLTTNHTVVQGFANTVRTYGHKKQQLYRRPYCRDDTWKSTLSSVRKTVRRKYVLQTN